MLACRAGGIIPTGFSKLGYLFPSPTDVFREGLLPCVLLVQHDLPSQVGYCEIREAATIEIPSTCSKQEYGRGEKISEGKRALDKSPFSIGFKERFLQNLLGRQISPLRERRV